MNIYNRLPKDIQQNIDNILLQKQNQYYNLLLLDLNYILTIYNKNFHTPTKLHIFCKGFTKGKKYRNKFTNK
tara:strand:- start:633 stop:848 length:216 start_codon:yes stop_codon:yes gene_type:complete